MVMVAKSAVAAELLRMHVRWLGAFGRGYIATGTVVGRRGPSQHTRTRENT